jgi:hypothetical protein
LPLSLPPADAEGVVTPHDHDGINANDRLIRRISHHYIVVKGGGRRISSAAYQASTTNGGMSVDLDAQIREAGLDPLEYVNSPQHIGSVFLPVGQVRQLGLMVGFNPTKVPDNPYHGEVWGISTKGLQRKVQGLATWHRAVPGVALA